MPLAVVRTVPPSLWMAMISRRLAGPARRLRELLRDDLLAAKRDDEHRADVRMPAVRGERFVGDAHVRAELAAAGEVRQRGRHRRGGRGDALGDDRRADHRRHDEHVIARADASVRPPIAEEAGGRS